MGIVFWTARTLNEYTGMHYSRFRGGGFVQFRSVAGMSAAMEGNHGVNEKGEAVMYYHPNKASGMGKRYLSLKHSFKCFRLDVENNTMHSKLLSQPMCARVSVDQGDPYLCNTTGGWHQTANSLQLGLSPDAGFDEC